MSNTDNHDAKYDSLLKGDYVKTIANGLDFFIGEKPAGFDVSKQSFFEIIDFRAGDVKLIWDRTKAIEVEAAKDTFEKLLKKGYAAFLVKDNDGNKGEKITSFDPNAERVIMIAPMQGG